jgi:hypothetical protein
MSAPGTKLPFARSISLGNRRCFAIRARILSGTMFARDEL